MISVYYDADFDIPEVVTGPAYYEARNRDRHCMKVFENTVTHQIHFYGYVSEMSEDTIEADNHYHLMEKLADVLPAGSTLILPRAASLSQNPEEASCLLDRFIDEKIQLECTHDAWLNFSFYSVLFKERPYEMRSALHNVLFTMLAKEPSTKENTTVAITQMSDDAKKNGI